MPSTHPLDRLLETYRSQALDERAKGTAFERLVAAWLTTDPVQAQTFKDAELWGDWARRTEQDRTDRGIDLVATRHDGKLAAIQCKFFEAHRAIQKADIDSFISASAKDQFAERRIVETTEVPWSENARDMLRGQTIPTVAIGLDVLRESPVDWSAFAATQTIERPKPKKLRADQLEAVAAVQAGLAEADRGKLLMACGTGKTLTSLRIAEDLAGAGGQVLVLVPSLALMAQSVREWCADALVPIRAFAVCSDSQVGKRRRSQRDVAELEVTDLEFPATTDPSALGPVVTGGDPDAMSVILATYHSISVIAAAQAEHGLPEFDLIICDEAHRTTGATLKGEEDSNFVKVHDNALIRGRKRLYMTATPRIYGETAKAKAKQGEAVLASMDDPKLYGDILFHHGFARAVESGILTDYRVIVLYMDEGQVNAAVQKRLADDSTELVLDDATKIVGCWKALSKTGVTGLAPDDIEPMQRALAFCRSIKSSQLVRNEFEQVVNEFQAEVDDDQNGFHCAVRHVDGNYNARERGKRLDWLKEDAGANACRILSNARCLTEGVDVPALDAILFLHARSSQIDVVQAVGRVMRKSPGKRMGYVILPVGVPPGIPPEKALSDNKRYAVIWQVLNALRAHDERLDAVINQGGLGQDVSDRILVINGMGPGVSAELKAVTQTVEDLPHRSKGTGIDIGSGGGETRDGNGDQPPLPLVIDQFSRAVMAKVVEKCGTRDYWDDWVGSVGEIAQNHVTRISALVSTPGSDAHGFFHDFLKELRDDLNPSVSETDAIEMLAQHQVTRPVFEALFSGHPFIEKNAVSSSMTAVLSVIDDARVSREAEKLTDFYARVRKRASGITDPQARQNLILELYDKFFRKAFPRTTKMLGIVYTPVEIVDFIIHSVNDVLEDEFGQNLGSEGVHILDPFVGTGTFITRLLQSGLIPVHDLERKYRHEIHANEIVLLAYYIAAINIESVFHSLTNRTDYLPFGGICLTDTFGLHEGDDQLSFYMKDNTHRRERQKTTDIRVIIGNPPYSVGQKSENDNAKNTRYAHLDSYIRLTYGARSSAGLVRNLYDPYVRAIRWGTDRLGSVGVLAYVTGAGWLDGTFADGLRKSLADDFTRIDVLHLRGDINKSISGGGMASEGENVFGQASKSGISVSVLVKNPNTAKRTQIRFHDIGDGLRQVDKLTRLRTFGSMRGVTRAEGWANIVPDAHGDWLDQRNTETGALPLLGTKRQLSERVMFREYSLGVVTNRDAWCINPSRSETERNVKRLIAVFNQEVERWNTARESDGWASPSVSEFVTDDATRISWTLALKKNLRNGRQISPLDGQYVKCLYRPFTKRWQFFSRRLNEAVYRMPSVFPTADLNNCVIAVTGVGAKADFSTLMMDALPSLHTLDTAQCFPMWTYEGSGGKGGALFGQEAGEYRRQEAITDFAVDQFQTAYPSEEVSREDIFYYVYGLLHSEDYRSRFRANLSKELPRIPCVKSAEDYRAFRDAGRRLGELHVNYESVAPYEAHIAPPPCVTI